MMQLRGVETLILLMGLLGQADSIPRVAVPRIRSTRYIRPGSEVVLPCSAEGSQNFRFTWMKYGQRMHVSTGQYGNLTIENFTLRDQGHYTCRVDDGEAYDISPVVSLVLAQLDDQWNVAVRIVMKIEMNPMSLSCDQSPLCVPPGKYSWYRIEGKTLNLVKTSNRIMTDNNGTLHFAFAEEEDGGIYRCGIHNTILDVARLGSEVNVTVQTYPSVRHFVNLNGGIRPSLMSYSAETTVVLGKEAKLECIFSGIPAPSVTWSRDGTKSKVDLKDGRILTIQNVHEGDGGNYTCSGMNSMGKVSKTIQLDVVSGPIWERKPITQDVSEGQEVTFVCTARAIGPTSPLVTQWIHDLGTNRRGITVSRDQSALTFHSVSGGPDCVTCNVSNNVDFISETACYKVTKSSPTLLILVTCGIFLVVILSIMVGMFCVINRKLIDMENTRFRLPSISSRRRRSTLVNATAGTSTVTGYLELETMPSRFSAATEYRLLTKALKQHPMGLPFHPVRKSTSHNFLRDATRTDANEAGLRPITRHNSDSCMSTRASCLHPNNNVRTSNHVFSSYTLPHRMVNEFGDSVRDIGYRNFSERHEEPQTGESLREARMDSAGWTHNCGRVEGNWSAADNPLQSNSSEHRTAGMVSRRWTPSCTRTMSTKTSGNT